MRMTLTAGCSRPRPLKSGHVFADTSRKSISRTATWSNATSCCLNSIRGRFRFRSIRPCAQAKALDAQKNAAEKDVARYRELVKSGGASKQQLEKAEADAAAYDAQIEAKNEEVKQFQLDLEYSRITAPIAGRISRAMLTEGNLVNAGGSDPLLTTIVALDPIYVYFSGERAALQRYMQTHPKEATEFVRRRCARRKSPFRFGLDSDKGYPHAGMLDFADNRVDPNTGTIQVRGVVDNKQGLFVPGSRVRVRVPVSDPYSAVLVPDTAILSDQDKRYLLVAGRQERRLAPRHHARQASRRRHARDLARGNAKARHHRRGADHRPWPAACAHQLPRRAGGAVNRPGRRDGCRSIGSICPHVQTGSSHLESRNMISHFFIDRPIFATVLSIVIVILGVVALSQLPIAQYPEVAPPTVQVTAIYPGANAETVAETVATPIEQEVNGVERMLYMSSKCTNDGQMYLDVTFELGTNLDMAQVLVQNRVSVAEAKLPEEVKRHRRDDEEEVAQHPAVRQPDLAGRRVTTSST